MNIKYSALLPAVGFVIFMGLGFKPSGNKNGGVAKRDTTLGTAPYFTAAKALKRIITHQK